MMLDFKVGAGSSQVPSVQTAPLVWGGQGDAKLDLAQTSSAVRSHTAPATMSIAPMSSSGP